MRTYLRLSFYMGDFFILLCYRLHSVIFSKTVALHLENNNIMGNYVNI